MAIYNYKGIDRKGTEKSGTVNAEGIAQAKQKVRAQGIMLTSIKEQKSKSGGGGGGFFITGKLFLLKDERRSGQFIRKPPLVCHRLATRGLS